MPRFTLELLAVDKLMSFYVKGGFRNFYLSPKMNTYFLFQHGGHFYRCIAMPFGWGFSGYWFFKLLRQFVKDLRDSLDYMVLPYIYDFLLAALPAGMVAM